MKLPNANIALVEREKITEYLLNREHPDNGGKAGFFLALGFSHDHWELLADSFHQIAMRSEVSQIMESAHGKKYIIDRNSNSWRQSSKGSNRLDCRCWKINW